uniref:FBD domain-containing protein n=1 Tax=Arundo donax TaxID=35708 RepID=A0A0A9AX80_ARUDO
MLLERFRVIHNLQIKLAYPTCIGNSPYLMEDITALPRLKILTLFLHNEGHAFGASLFHVLRMCTRLRGLSLVLHTHSDLEAQSACPSDCVCDQPINWKAKELTLKRLQEVVIIDMKGTDHEVAFVKRLFSWAVKLRRMRVVYHSVAVSKAKEVHQKLLRLAMPETHVTLEEYPCE